MTRALVTGAQGFAGRYLVAELLAVDPTVEITGIGRSRARDRFTHDVTVGQGRVAAPLPAELAVAASDARYRYVQADIRDGPALRAILRAFRPNWIFHFASGLRDDAPSHLFGTNVEGTIEFLEAVGDESPQVERIVVGSSGSVYGNPAVLPVHEEAACAPGDVYAVSKLAQEHVARITATQRNLPLAIARIFNIVGAGQDERHVAGRFASQLAAIAAGAGPARLHVGDLSTARDFIDVRDVARALVLLAREPKVQEVYNIAGGVETPIGEVLGILLNAARLRGVVEVERTYSRAADIPRAFASIERLRAAGYAPSVPLTRSLADVLDYYRSLHRSAEIVAERV